jgi:uncharacterized protein YodC (DUF2158 family)
MKITTKFSPGDVVTLINGGPKMTVDAVCVNGNPDHVGLIWFYGTDNAGWVGPFREVLAAGSLKLVELTRPEDH